MIIELFGPPGAGKTTLARALGARLRARNMEVTVFSSSRPNEIAADVEPQKPPALPDSYHGIMMRLRRPFGELAGVVRHPIRNYPQFITAMRAMRMFHGQGITGNLRQAQYLVRLAQSWKSAERMKGVVIFDQGFVQALCSLALASGETRKTVIEDATQKIPAPHMTVRVIAPSDAVASRLKERRCRLSSIERYLEGDAGRVLRDLAIYDLVTGALGASGRRVTTVTSLDDVSLEDAVAQITEQVGGLLSNEWRGAA